MQSNTLTWTNWATLTHTYDPPIRPAGDNLRLSAGSAAQERIFDSARPINGAQGDTHNARSAEHTQDEPLGESQGSGGLYAQHEPIEGRLVYHQPQVKYKSTCIPISFRESIITQNNPHIMQINSNLAN